VDSHFLFKEFNQFLSFLFAILWLFAGDIEPSQHSIVAEIVDNARETIAVEEFIFDVVLGS